MANNFIDTSIILDENRDNFPTNNLNKEVALNSPFKERSIFQEIEEEIFPLESQYGKLTHLVKSEK
jgi:hypothetical protein